MSNLPPLKPPDPRQGAGLGILLGPQKVSEANTQTRAEARAAGRSGPHSPRSQDQGCCSQKPEATAGTRDAKSLMPRGPGRQSPESERKPHPQGAAWMGRHQAGALGWGYDNHAVVETTSQQSLWLFLVPNPQEGCFGSWDRPKPTALPLTSRRRGRS